MMWHMVLCMFLHHMSYGIISALPAIAVPDITRNGTFGINVTADDASWFTASYGLTGPVGYLIISPIMQKYGRKITCILYSSVTVIGCVVIALAGDITTMIVGRCIQGIAFGSLHFSCIMVAEYTHPKRRGFFLVFKIIGVNLGELICHGLGGVMTWRQLVWIGAAPAALCAIGTLQWIESPAWYAFKGRYEECAIAFEKMRGKDREARLELKELILAQQEIREMFKTSYDSSLKATLKAFRCKEFLKPLFILSMSTILMQACGSYFMAPYLIEIMVKITKDSSSGFYFTLGFDFMKIVAVLLASGIVWRFNRRVILFISGSLACIFLALMSLFHFLDGKGFIGLVWLTPSTLLIYIFLCSIGILPISIVTKGELFPLEYRGLGVCTIGIFFSVLTIVTLKMTSKMLVVLDVHGTFAVYLVIIVSMLIILYFILPETKDRSMQNIETDFIDLKLTHKDDGDNDEVLNFLGDLVKSTTSNPVSKADDCKTVNG